MELRIEKLETKLAHLELAVDELNQVVYKQAKQLDTTHRLIENLQGRLKEVMEEGQDQPWSAEDERPPHY